MKTRIHIHSILLAGLTLIGLSLATPRAHADQDGIKPFKGTDLQVSKTDLVLPDSFPDPFLADRDGFILLDTIIYSEGLDNVGGLISSTAHQRLYWDGGIVFVYMWIERTAANGNKTWAGIEGVLSMGVVTGDITVYGEDDPGSEPIGEAQFVSTFVGQSEDGQNLFETVFSGWIATVGGRRSR